MRAELPADAQHFEIVSDGLLVWYGSRESEPLLYDLSDPVNELRPRNAGQRQLTHGPTLEARRLIFERASLTWPQWMEVWRGGPTATLPVFGPGDRELTLLPPQRPNRELSPSLNGKGDHGTLPTTMVVPDATIPQAERVQASG